MANNNGNEKAKTLKEKMIDLGEIYISSNANDKKRIRKRIESQMPDPNQDMLTNGCLSQDLRQALEKSKKQRTIQAVENYIRDCCKEYTQNELKKDDEKGIKEIDEAVKEWFKKLRDEKVVAIGREMCEDDLYDDDPDSYLEIRPHKFANRCPLDYGREKIVSFDPSSDKEILFSFEKYFNCDIRHPHAWFKADDPKKLEPPRKLKKVIKDNINFEIHSAE